MDRKAEDRDVPRHEKVKKLIDELHTERKTGELNVRFNEGGIAEVFTKIKVL